MDEEKIYLELIKGGIQFVVDSFTQVISEINKMRLNEKIKRKQKDTKQIFDPNTIVLKDAEKFNAQVNLNVNATIENIKEHIESIEKWAHIIKFSDLDKKKTLKSVYIQLDTFLLPAKRHFSLSERDRTIALEKAVLKGEDNCIILGHPGAGKTTSLKKICDLVIKESRESNYTFPILLRLRDIGEINSPTPILDHILNIIPLEFKYDEKKEIVFLAGINEAKEEAIFYFLNYVKPILILDGFDELKDSNAKVIVLRELSKITRKLKNTKFVLSCRTGEFHYELDYSNTYEIAPLNEKQIELFVNKWLKDENKAKDFLQKVKSSPFADTSIKPLSLAHLCAIYERIGNVPDQPKTIYRKVVNLLIEEWDEQRSIIRKSSFDSFHSDQKFEFLSHLAFHLTVVYKSSIFSVSEFTAAYQEICDYHNLPPNKASSIVKELESHTGLFIESGYEKFEFVHKSIQEYLTAEYIVKLISPNTIKKHFETLGAELAISVSISSNSSLYFVELVLNYFSRSSLSRSFYSAFTSRIISENPSFNQDPFVSVAALVLLSQWVNPENRHYNQISCTPDDIDKYSSFFDLSKSLNLKSQKVNIFTYYKYETGVKNNSLVELRRIKEPVKHKRLPSKIYIPIEYYIEFDK